MVHDRSIRGPLLLALALATACSSAPEDETALGRPVSSRIVFAQQWSNAVQDLGRVPILPLTEDVYVGDLLALSAPPDFGSARTAGGLRTTATPRWKSLQVLADLDAEYRARPTWTHTADTGQRVEAGADGESIYRADRAPARHRIIGLRTLGSMTVDTSDLEPFLPIEVAPLIEGPATSDRIAVSVQTGEAEVYSLSLDAMIDQLLEPTVEEAGGGYQLRAEHRKNLPLVADPITGNVYLVVLTEVLYVRSVEVTIRRKTLLDEDGQPLPEADPDEEDAEALLGAREGQEVTRGVAAILRAEAMNDALGDDGTDRIGGSIHVVTATDHALTLRRRWPYPLAMAARGFTVEVVAATGEVLRMAPLGIDLPELPPPPAPEPPPAAEGQPEPAPGDDSGGA